MADAIARGESGEAGRAGLGARTKYYVLSYPLFWLGVTFLVPIGMLLVFSFYRNISGGSYEPALTLENYVRFLTSSLYQQQLWLTIEISIVTALVCLLLGYPMAYYLFRVRSAWIRNALMIAIVSTLWITYVIRAYAWQVILARGGIASQLGQAVGLLDAPTSFYPGYWALIVGMVYVFLPFLILTVYNSLRNVDEELLEASKNLRAGPFRTFRKVTAPLSKNGVVSGVVLVFILALGAYVLPRLLGTPAEWTLPVLIEQQINQERNVPYAAVLSSALIVVVVGFLWGIVRATDLTAAGLGGGNAIEGEETAPAAGGAASAGGGAVRGVLGRAVGALATVGAPVSRRGHALVTTVDARTRERAIGVALRAYVALVTLFVVLPLAIIAAVSFTPGEFLAFPPKGFSLRWYVTFFTDSDWMGALAGSLGIATGAAVLSTTIGGGLAFALDRFEYERPTLLSGLGVLPILVPPVILGVAFLVFFLQVGLAGSHVGIVVAHGVFYSAFPFILVSQGLDEIDRSYEEAAMNLGASPTLTVRTITYPLLRANVVSGALFAFILSLNEYIIAWLLSLFLVNTIPIQLFTSLRYGYDPDIAAASVVFMLLTVVVMVSIDRLTGGIWE